MQGTKPLYISRAVSNFYGTEIEIWAGFGPVENTKKMGQLWATFEGIFSKKNIFSKIL